MSAQRLLGVAAMLLAAAVPASAETYQIDAVHSSVGFKIRHMAVSRVPGRFNAVEGYFVHEPGNLAIWKASATIDASSINTDNAKRDEHLRTPEFFDVARCPTLEFRSTKVSGAKGGRVKLHGELTLHCVTRPVTLDLEISEPTQDMQGNLRVGASATGRIQRGDFEMVWSKRLDKGGLLLGEEVDISIDIEGVAKGAAESGGK